jgi:HK97 family phage prohead protease
MKKLNKLFAPIELKEFKEQGEYGYFEGYASVFNYIDSDSDIVLKGAFQKSIQERPNVKMLWQHDMRQPIGKYTELSENDNGLFVKGEINLQTEKGREAYALAKQGALDSMSIGFMTKDYEMDSQRKVRKIKQVDLYEISLVTFPANDKATLTGVKSAFVEKPKDVSEMTIREFEHALRDVGCSWKQAELIARSGFKAVSALRDEDESVNDEQAVLVQLANLLNSK